MQIRNQLIASDRSHGRCGDLLAVLLYLLGFYLLTFPAMHDFSTCILAQGGGDTPQNIWNCWWIRYAVEHGKSPWFSDFLYYPHGTTLVTATLNPFNGFMTVPMCWFVGAVTAYNVMIVFSFVVCGYTMFLLAREVTGHYWGSVFAGVVLTFGPFHMGHGTGHMQLVSLEWLPLFFLFWLRFLREPTHLRGVAAAVALFLNLLCDYYFTLFCILGGALMVLYQAAVARPRLFLITGGRWKPLATFVVAAIVLCAPILGSLAWYLGQEEYVGSHDPMDWRNDLFAFLIPGWTWMFSDWTKWYWAKHPAQGGWLEFGPYLGITVMTAGGMAVVAAWRGGQRTAMGVWLVLGIVFYALSLGPVLLVLNQNVPQVPTPYAIFEKVVPIFKMAGCPSRMAVVTALAAAVLAAWGIAVAGKRWPFWFGRVLWVPFMALFIFEYLPFPYRTHYLAIPPVISRLAKLPQGCVAGLTDDDPDTLQYQTIFEKPIPSGYVARWPMRLQIYRLQIDRLGLQGRYREMMAGCQATYLLRERIRMPQVTDRQLKLLDSDDRFELFARLDHPSPGVPVGELLDARPTIRLLLTDNAEECVVEVLSPRDRGKMFCCALSTGRLAEPIVYQQHQWSLALSDMLLESLSRPSPLLDGNWTRLDDTGCARLRMRRSEFGHPMAPISVWASLIICQGDEVAPVVVRVEEPQPLHLPR